MAEDKRKVTFVFLDNTEEEMPIKDGVILEARGKGFIKGGRPPFEEPAPVKEIKKSTTKKSETEGDK